MNEPLPDDKKLQDMLQANGYALKAQGCTYANGCTNYYYKQVNVETTGGNWHIHLYVPQELSRQSNGLIELSAIFPQSKTGYRGWKRYYKNYPGVWLAAVLSEVETLMREAEAHTLDDLVKQRSYRNLIALL